MQRLPRLNLTGRTAVSGARAANSLLGHIAKIHCIFGPVQVIRMGSTETSSPFTSATQFNIVALETFFTELPKLSVPSPHTFSITEYNRTKVEEIPSRIKDADILITTTIPLRAEHLSAKISPRLKLIAVVASGTDSIDLAACDARSIRVLSSPNCNVTAVAEHAVALYFTARRSIVPTMRDLRAGEWPVRGTLMKGVFAGGRPPISCSQEVVTVIGYGGVGQKVAKTFEALGMQVVVAARKGTTASDGRVDFEVALSTATVVVLCCPRSKETLGLLSGPEFALMRKEAVVVNVARGGIVDEQALLTALKDGQIAGAAVDVFDTEPAGPKTSPLLGEEAESLNLVVTPHTAWVGDATTTNYQRVLQENINNFILGKVKEERVKA